jgi:hypothetical protein
MQLPSFLLRSGGTLRGSPELRPAPVPPPSEVVRDMRFCVGSGEWRGALHCRWDEGTHCVRVRGRWRSWWVSGWLTGGMSGSGSPELGILVKRKNEYMRSSDSDLRFRLFQGSIVVIHRWSVITPCSSDCPQYGRKNQVKSGFQRVITILSR